MSVSSFLRRLITWRCSRLLLSAGRAARDRHRLHATPRVVGLSLLQQCVAAAQWDGRTDRQTPDSYIDPDYSAFVALANLRYINALNNNNNNNNNNINK